MSCIRSRIIERSCAWWQLHLLNHRAFPQHVSKVMVVVDGVGRDGVIAIGCFHDLIYFVPCNELIEWNRGSERERARVCVKRVCECV